MCGVSSEPTALAPRATSAYAALKLGLWTFQFGQVNRSADQRRCLWFIWTACPVTSADCVWSQCDECLFHWGPQCVKCIKAQFGLRCLRGQGIWESDRYHEHGYNSYLLHFNSAAIMHCTLRVTPRLTSRVSHWHTSDSDCTVNYPSTFHWPGVEDREWVHPCIQPTAAMPPPEVKPICRRERQEDIGLFFFLCGE